MYKILGGDGKEYGPVSAETLKQWISEGRANVQTRVQAEGAADWTAIGQLPEFAASFTVPTVPKTIGPSVTSATASNTNSMALTGMILGICSLTIGLFCCGPLMAIAGIVFSSIGLSQIGKNPGQQGKGMAIAGLITSILGLIVGVIIAVFFGLVGALGEMAK